jgi:hypothetical protein
VITGRLELSEDGPPSVIADHLQSLDAILKGAELVVVRIAANEDPEVLFDNVLHLLNTYPGNCDVNIELEIEGNTLVKIRPNTQLKISRSEKLDSALRELGCVVRVERVNQGGV